MSIEKIIIVDEQQIIIPSLEEWNNFLINPLYKGIPVYSVITKNIVYDLIQFVSKNAHCFCLGLLQEKAIKKSWSVLPLFKINNSWQRVQIERISCFHCDWKGTIANPTETSLYFTVPNRWKVLDSAASLPRLNCPNCGKTLPRHAIWVENFS